MQTPSCTGFQGCIETLRRRHPLKEAKASTILIIFELGQSRIA